MKKSNLPIERIATKGVALILVLLSMLVLSVLAATIVFTARAETFSSYNYKLGTQADYLAKAGIQYAINWFESNRYAPVPEVDVTATIYANSLYNLTSTGAPFNLFTANTSPIQCLAASGCPSPGSTVQLIGIPGTGNSNYPKINNPAGVDVTSAFWNDLAGNGSGVQLAGDNMNSGRFYINAVLRNYATVNKGSLPNVTRTAMETWYITSHAVWNGPAGTSVVAVAEETAVIEPIYVPTFANAMYGYCSVAMNGSSGTCTDAYSSAMGPYGSKAAGPCDSTSANVIDTNAGVGANGSVSLIGSVVVSGDVTVGSNPPAGCPATGYNGGGKVLGQVVNGPPVPAPAAPTFPGTGQAASLPPGQNFPGTGSNAAPSYTSSTTLPWTSSGNLPWTSQTGTQVAAGACPGYYFIPGAPPSPPYYYQVGVPPLATYYNGAGVLIAGPPANPPWTGAPPVLPAAPPPAAANSPQYTTPPLNPPVASVPPPGPQYTQPCMTTAGVTCNGTMANPYLISSISITGGTNTVSLVGGQDVFHPVYYDIDTLTESGNTNLLQACGYIVLNVQTTLQITGQGATNTGFNNAPETTVINYAGTTASIGGNGSVSAVIIAPNATVTLKGGGSGGYMLGAVMANNVQMSGGFPLHYDIQLMDAGGTLGKIVTISYNRSRL